MNSQDFVRKKEEIQLEIRKLKSLLKEKENNLHQLITDQNKHTLSAKDITRYSRQIIVPSIGVQGQEKLIKASVLIVGCGGLGCPAAQYLTGCGVGRIGLVDYDEVEENNLHRQLLHAEDTVGLHKVDSLANALKKLNSNVQIDKHHLQLNSKNALEILSKYDIVIDASDNVPTRYLVNDACILNNRPLVSGSAVRMEGQLTVYNYLTGPCYRCLFPHPPPPEAVSNCGDVGVLGPVPGVIGVLQALQAVHIIVESGGELSGKLLLFDGMDSSFRTIKLRNKNPSCSACGENSKVKLIDYEQFCGSPANDKLDRHLKILNKSQRISPQNLLEVIKNQIPHILIDVRSPMEFEMCSIPGSINIPLDNLSKSQSKTQLQEIISNEPGETQPSVYVICRRGNDSQIGVKKLLTEFDDLDIFDLKGGLHAWARDVDPTFPVY